MKSRNDTYIFLVLNDNLYILDNMDIRSLNFWYNIDRLDVTKKFEFKSSHLAS